MRVGKQYLGKFVAVQWMDPNFERVDFDSVTKGRAALATWVEYGVVHDISDGVVLIVHSAASGAGQPPPPERTDELARTAVHEALIEKITVYEPGVSES